MRSLCAAFALSIFALLVPSGTYAADLVFTPGTGSYGQGVEFTARVTIDPTGQNVNAADGVVSFDKETLSVVSVSKEGSVFSLWTAEPSFSNADGTVTFSGGTPTAFSNRGTVIAIKFKGKTLGTASASFSKASVLAADGKGTDVFKTGGTATFTITEAVEAPAPKAPPPKTAATAPVAAGGETPGAPAVNSSTHAKPDDWYATSTAVFTWIPTPDIVGARSIFSQADDAVPKVVLAEGVSSETVQATQDGEWYYFLQFRNDFGWGEIGKKRVRIDTTPPEEFAVTLLEESADGSPPRLAFETTDALSGIARYEISIGSIPPISVRAQDLVNGAYPVPPQEGGAQNITVKAFDKASNVREAKVSLTLPAVAKPNPKGGKSAEEEAPRFWTIERVLTLLLAIAVGALVTWVMYLRKGITDDRAKVLARVFDLREKNDRIFSALREEFEQMIKDLDVKPQLTPAEREFLEKTKEVLDISEELLDTGIEELKKAVRGQ